MPETKIQARQRKLNKKIGSVGTDPFIPARMPGQIRPHINIPSQPMPSLRRQIRWGWVALIISVVVLVGLFAVLKHLGRL